MTVRLYYDDSYLRRFTSSVVSATEDRQRVTLDRTAFYPTSGGQSFDTGSLGEARVVDVVEDQDDIVHVLDRPLDPGTYNCEIDWPRRFDHMQQHSGQHLLSAVFEELFHIPTLSVHLGQETSTIDLATAALHPEQISRVEERAEAIVFENRPVTVSYHEAADEQIGLRKQTDREGIIRVVSIDDCDRSACGGTHVSATGEIGPILIGRLDKVRGNTRVEFCCGKRALSRLREDNRHLTQTCESQAVKLAEAEKQRRKLALELAVIRGRDLHAATAPGARGLRVHIRRRIVALDDVLRAEAQAFTSQGSAVFVAECTSPPSLVLAVSEASGIAAGAMLSPLVQRLGGRGGGNASMAQASLPTTAAVDAAVAGLLDLIS